MLSDYTQDWLLHKSTRNRNRWKDSYFASFAEFFLNVCNNFKLDMRRNHTWCLSGRIWKKGVDVDKQIWLFSDNGVGAKLLT